MLPLVVLGIAALVLAGCSDDSSDTEEGKPVDGGDGPDDVNSDAAEVQSDTHLTDTNSGAIDQYVGPDIRDQHAGHSDTDLKQDIKSTGEVKITAGAPNRFLLTGGTIVTFNNNFKLSVIPNGQMLTEGDAISCVSDVNNPCDVAGDETTIELPPSYKIYAGLIDPHNHPHYNAFPIFLHPGSDYENSADWRNSDEYDEWKAHWFDANKDSGKTCQMYQYGILRALVGGATTIQGVSVNNKCLRSSKDKPWILRQIDSFNGVSTDDKVKTNSMGVGSLDDAQVADICSDQSSGAIDRFIIHLSEGVQGNTGALKEYENLQTWGDGCLFNPKSVFIHCGAFTQIEFDPFAESGARVVWSPSSNTDLYGFSAKASLDVPLATSEGIDVALGPDWYPSHGIGMVVEMNSALNFSKEFFDGSVDTEQIYSMATVMGAGVAGLEEYIGRLIPEMKADITIIAGKTSDPFEPAGLGEVAGVFVGGTIYYGDEVIMSVANVPDAECEDLNVCNVAKTLCLPPTYDEDDKKISFSALRDSFIWIPDLKKPDETEPFSAVPFDELPEACLNSN